MEKQLTNRTTRRHALKVGAGAVLSGVCLNTPLRAASSERDLQWWTWRGPMGNNHAAPANALPQQLTEQHIRSAVPIPGRGHSSPIVVGSHVYLTTADTAAGTQSVVAVERSGRIAWTQIVHRGGIPAENHAKNTEASPTVAFDGEGLLASFYNSDAIWLSRLSTDGEIVWQKNIGAYRPNKFKYGYAASPLIYGDLVIIAGDYDGDSFLAAHDCRSGSLMWKIDRPGGMTFSSPIVASIRGQDQLLLSGCDMVACYAPRTGKRRWQTPTATTMATCGTMVWDGDMVFASGGYPESETVGIRAEDGKLAWTNRVKCYEQSMLTKDGYLYAVADSGVAYCWRCPDGKTMWKERLGGKYSSSPLLVQDTIHVFNETGDGFAFLATPDDFNLVGTNKLSDEVFASPVVVDNTMYLRVAHHGATRQESLLMLS